MAKQIAPGALDFASLIRPGEQIVWGQACGEPQTLVETLMAQRAALGGISAFVGSSFSQTVQPEHADHVRFLSMGAIGTLSRLSRAGALEIIPCHVGQIGAMIAQGLIACDIVLVQVSPPDGDGRHSFGLINDYLQAATRKARLVIAEVNDQVPYTFGDAPLGADQVDFWIETSRPPVTLARAEIGKIDRTIAAHVSNYIEDGATLQMGIGAAPEAIMRLIGDRRDLGIHSGMIGDGVAELMRAGVITNARKSYEPGVTITGALLGGASLYEFAHRNPAIGMRRSEITHGAAAIEALPNLISINSAIEVDVTGQINAEQAGATYLGGTGGQVDYVRAGARSPGGRSIIALPATAKEGTLSRIVMHLSGPVTTARAETDVIVTEFGWPSGPKGGTETNTHTGQKCAVASPKNQVKVIKSTLQKLAQKNWSGIVFEAFSEDWKPSDEGNFGRYWGICQGQPPYTCVKDFK